MAQSANAPDAILNCPAERKHVPPLATGNNAATREENILIPRFNPHPAPPMVKLAQTLNIPSHSKRQRAVTDEDCSTMFIMCCCQQPANTGRNHAGVPCRYRLNHLSVSPVTHY